VAKSNKLPNQVLAVMERAFRTGHELALLDCIVFCHGDRDLGRSGQPQTLPDWAFDTLAARARDQANGKKHKRKRRRHELSFTEQEKFVADARCFDLVNELRHQSLVHRRGEDAFTAATHELHLDRETVREAYYRARRKRLARSSNYISLLYLQDPLGYLIHNSLL
jgi:hypothetical protein